ncbi:hypothetical protein Cassandra_0303 [Pseudomonas phage Cassandra]|nr:hypothetical protein Cassandra_0303 [Pseudomonas phage Cassandra]
MESQAFFKIFLNYFLPSCIRARAIYSKVNQYDVELKFINKSTTYLLSISKYATNPYTRQCKCK